MKGLAELVLSLCDLAEAEGRSLRKNLLLAGQGCAFMGAAVLFIAAALAFIIAAAYEGLLLFAPRYAAFLLMAVLSFAFAFLLFWSAKKCMPLKKKQLSQQSPKNKN